MSCNSDNRRRKVKKQLPQKTVDDFWSAFTTKFPGKVYNILPKNPYARSKAASEPKGTVHGHGARESYDEAKADCVAAVEKIATECRRVNMRYRDPHFDIEWDLKSKKRDCLDGLLLYPDAGEPRSVKRVPQIFENPQFYVDGATAGDVRQGRSGDCWFLAALGALGNKKDLIEKVCVARDEAVGVYGFVFYRDGSWINTVIDDKLYLSVPDWDESLFEKVQWLQIPNRQDAEEEYRKVYQTGSRALYFAQCNTENETWLPLLEKAFAKAHGDYYAIDGGFTGEAIEDLTGGVTTELFTSDILDIDKFWKEELMRVNDEFLFGCATGRFDDWQGGGKLTDRKGIQSGHAYSIMEAREVEGEKLLKLRNPWGETEWSGAWSDGSEQWTPEWMQLLNHRFGDDGVFWISYKDLLRKYQFFDRTRLFSRDWSVTQQWTSIDVPWSADYNDTKFSFTLTKSTPIVIVLSQLDDRYWDGLRGQYSFSLHFRVSKDDEDDYIVRSHGNYSMTRSVSTELKLDAGCYTVRIRVTAKRDQRLPTVEEVVRMNCKKRQEKLLQIGMSYDLAHARGIIVETEEEKERKAEKEAKDEAAIKAKAREEAKKRKHKDWLRDKKRIERNRREKQRRDAHMAKKEGRGVNEDDRGYDTRVRRPSIEKEVATMWNDTKAKANQPPLVGPGSVDERAATGNGVHPSEEGAESAKDGDYSPVPSLTVEFNSSRIDGESAPTRADNIQAAPPSSEVGNGSHGPVRKPSSQDSEPTQTGPATTQEVSEQPQGMTVQEKIEKFHSDSGAKATSLPAVKVNGDKKMLPTPPLSPDLMAPRFSRPLRSEASEPDTVVTYVSSFDSELDERYFGEDYRGDGYRDCSINVSAVAPEGDDDELEEYYGDPWNAVCIIGLRLYTKEGEASVKVVRPPEDEDEEDKEEAALDVDDPMKSMSNEPVTPVSPLKDKSTETGSIAERLASQIPTPKNKDDKLEYAAA